MLIFLNDDCEITDDNWYPSLLAPFQDPLVNVVGCRLVYPDGRLQHAGVYLDFVDGVFTAHNYLEEQPSGPTEAVTGACMAVRREHAWFDPQFLKTFEDRGILVTVSGDKDYRLPLIPMP